MKAGQHGGGLGCTPPVGAPLPRLLSAARAAAHRPAQPLAPTPQAAHRPLQRAQQATQQLGQLQLQRLGLGHSLHL